MSRPLWHAVSKAAAEPAYLRAEPDRVGGPGGQRLAGQGRPGHGDTFLRANGGGLAGGEATMRRSSVDRLTATLLYADRNSRKSSLRRRSPLTVVARLASRLEACPLGKVKTGIVPAPAALRRIVDIVGLTSCRRGSEVV